MNPNPYSNPKANPTLTLTLTLTLTITQVIACEMNEPMAALARQVSQSVTTTLLAGSTCPTLTLYSGLLSSVLR